MVKLRVFIGVLVVIVVLAGMSAGVQAQSDEGLVAEWHFDVGGGNVVKDSSGNGNDGVIYGATWVDGKYGKALSFDGVDDYVEILMNVPEYDFTISLWIKTTSSNAGVFSVLSQPAGSDGNDRHFYLNSGKVCHRVWKGSGWCTNHIVNDGNWHHWTLTVKNGEGQKAFIDGKLIDTNSFDHSDFNWQDRIWIGFSNDASNKYFNGTIDEVGIYNRVLSAEEVKEHYEQGPTALSLTKTATPNSIKQGQNTTITLTVKNTGSTEISDIEIADTIPSYLTFDGETSKTYDSLAPKDTRQISYTLQFNDAGTFNLEPAIATYADDKGNYNTVKSKPESIEVIRSIIENSAPTSKPMNGNVQSASVNLHGEKTDVALGEDVLLKLSAVNIIGNPTMHVQVIIIPPSGWSVTSSEFAKSGAGQYTTTYELESGGGKDIEVRIVPNQIGDDFQVDGRIIYYFGDDVGSREDHTLNLPITVRAEAEPDPEPDEVPSTPGFAGMSAVVGLLATTGLVKRNKMRL